MTRRPAGRLATAVLAVAAVFLLPPSAGRAADPPVPAERCPVMPTEPVSSEFKTEHLGRTVFFCCAGCVEKFRANPDAYLANMPAVPPVPRPNPRPWSWWQAADPVFLAADVCGRRQTFFAYLLGVLLAVVVAARISRRLGRGEAAPGRAARLLGAAGRPSTFAVLVMAGVCVELWQDRARAEAAVEEARLASRADARGRDARSAVSIQYLNWAWPQALHTLPKGLKNTFYRGNDERSPKLFNGGNYRTATFHLAVRTEDGRDIDPGANLAGRTLVASLELVRAPKTAPNFYTTDQMARVFLAPLGENATPDVAVLTPTEPGWRWSTAVPVGAAPPAGYKRLTAVWAVCVGKPDLGVAGGIVHYYVQCVLHFQDGVVLPESSIWMIPVYASPILHGPEADGQWFSDVPIPEITEDNTTDPKLLGIPAGGKK